MNKTNSIVNAIIFLVYLVIMVTYFKNEPIIIVTLLFTIITTILNVYTLSSFSDGFNDYPMLIITNTLFYIQIILSLIILFLTFIPFDISLIIQTILLALHVILYLLLKVSKKEIETVEAKYEGYTKSHEDIEKAIQTLIIKNKAEDINENLEELNEQIKSSNPTSNKSIQAIDETIISELNHLDRIINSDATDEIKTTINNISDLIKQRDIYLKR